MKFITLILIVGMSFILNATPSNKLIDAICKVESNNGMYIVGDNGKAIGCLQIWKTVVDDVNKYSKVKYSYADRYNKMKSYEIFKLYIGHYATKKRRGRKPTNEDMARIWNGGPNGYKKTSTIKYWNKVKKYI